jgi:RNA polymerase sigma-70 factor (ECF subfamily)
VALPIKARPIETHPNDPQLLSRIQDSQDTFAWHEFVKVYAPLVYGFGRRSGLGDSQAADLARETLRAVARSVERSECDLTRTGFRDWLFGIAKSQYEKISHQRQFELGTADPQVETVFAQAIGAGASQSLWDEEYESCMADWAAQQVRPKLQENTWRAFWKTLVEQNEPVVVAHELGIQPGEVFLAACRGLAAFRLRLEQLGDRP